MAQVAKSPKRRRTPRQEQILAAQMPRAIRHDGLGTGFVLEVNGKPVLDYVDSRGFWINPETGENLPGKQSGWSGPLTNSEKFALAMHLLDSLELR